MICVKDNQVLDDILKQLQRQVAALVLLYHGAVMLKSSLQNVHGYFSFQLVFAKDPWNLG